MPHRLIKLGARIKQIRTKKNISQNELALMCEIEKSNMSRLESGQGNPTILTLFKICDALEISIEELFKEDRLSSG
jgi:transcriptional regulator with XRE-family HTH domain